MDRADLNFYHEFEVIVFVDSRYDDVIFVCVCPILLLYRSPMELKFAIQITPSLSSIDKY